MKITVHYLAQLKQAAGTASERIDLEQTCTLQELAHRLAQRHGDALRRLLLNASGDLHSTNLFFVNDVQARPIDPINDGDVVIVLSPIAGGCRPPM